MAKRGRPPHPEILTPREWQVLDLLRQDLTNEQIAHRLDISFATAKYHVAEIISKLGVQTREEAAAWQPEAAPARPWWDAAFAILRRGWPLAGVAGALAAVAGLALLAWGVWRTNDDDRNLTPANGTTVADVHRGITEAITQDRMVLHATVTTAATSSDPRFQPTEDGESKSELWIDPAQETARTGYSDVGPPRDVVIYTGGRFYYISGGDTAIPVSGLGPICNGVGGVSALLLDYTYDNCPDSTEVLSGNRNGTAAIVLKQTWIFRNEDGDPTGGARTTWLYFDRNTYLPLGTEFEVDGFVTAGGSSSVTVEFVHRDSLSEDFFAPESIGYVDRCVAFRIENGGPACYLAVSGTSDAEFVIDETIRLVARKGVDIVDRQTARAIVMTAKEALQQLDERNPEPQPPSSWLGPNIEPLNQEVWLVEANGIFGDRRGGSSREPLPPLIRGTMLAVVLAEGGSIEYSDVVFE